MMQLALTDAVKSKIDSMSREDLAWIWRYAPVGDPYLCGVVGDYFAARFKELGGFSPAISKAIGPPR